MGFVSSRGCERAAKGGAESLPRTRRHTYLYPPQLWFGTARSVVVYIVPVSKKHSFFLFLYTHSPGYGVGQYDIAQP